jgi:Zinc carboxypeptidase
MRNFLLWLSFAGSLQINGQDLITPFERSRGMETATYFECIDFYKKLDKLSAAVLIRQMGMSDAGYPYHLILYSNDGKFDPGQWHRQNKLVILIINGIHPGEPDGVDASMMLLRDLTSHKIAIPDNIALAIIPIYNIGGSLNRNSFSRVNQNGPESYGFRGNAQNLDLNRDFTKNDSWNARSFAQIFHWLDPDIQIDNHVSDGADYQHTMTLISTQWNKLGGQLGSFVHSEFDPAIYRSMKNKGWPVCPYVNFEDGDPEKGWQEFYDPPRYSSGYAALFHTIAYMPETHMLKPFRDRVYSTYALIQSLIDQASLQSKKIIEKRKEDFSRDLQASSLALSWKPDESQFDTILFKGYATDYKTSEVTGQQRMFYNHNKPFEKDVKYYDYFSADKMVTIPKAYLIPQGWHEVVDLLKLQGIAVRQLSTDSTILVEAYHIDQYQSSSRPYEKHHRNSAIKVSAVQQSIKFLKGDYIIDTHQLHRRFLVEMLEPTGDDSYFSWNFFDAILQQKEGYSDYRWEDVAASWLNTHPDLRLQLEERKKTDTAFAHNARAQLDFVYKNSSYYEPVHLRYPVFRLL